MVLAIPVATVAWTVTHEEIFHEARDWCKWHSETCGTFLRRKFFYLFTCEFCLSFYVAAAAVAVTGFQLLYPGWRGYGVSILSLVWIANLYMSFFGRLRLDIRRERVDIADREEERNIPPCTGESLMGHGQAHSVRGFLSGTLGKKMGTSPSNARTASAVTVSLPSNPQRRRARRRNFRLVSALSP